MAGRTIQEKRILSVAGVVLAFVVLFGLFYAKGLPYWRKSWKQYANEKALYARECALIAKKPDLLVEYDREKSQMKLFEPDEDTKTTWLRKIDKLAREHMITLSSLQAGEEAQDGEVYELAIEVRNWEGALDHLVPFMHELENSDDGMFDVRSISFTPNPKTGRLKGSFVVTCAYMRGTDAKKTK